MRAIDTRAVKPRLLPSLIAVGVLVTAGVGWGIYAESADGARPEAQRVRKMRPCKARKRAAARRAARARRQAAEARRGRRERPRKTQVERATNFVDADGRSYNVSYQQLVPRIVFRADGFEGRGATFYLKYDDGTVVKEATTYGRVARDDVRADATARFWFEAGGDSTPRTRLRVRLDDGGH